MSLFVQDFPELGQMRGMLARKYGKEFTAEAADDSICRKWSVNDNLRRQGSLLAADHCSTQHAAIVSLLSTRYLCKSASPWKQ